MYYQHHCLATIVINALSTLHHLASKQIELIVSGAHSMTPGALSHSGTNTPNSSAYIAAELMAYWSFLPARRYASAGNSDRNVSVRPSVTRRYCVKTKKASGVTSSPSGSPKTLVFRCQISSPNSKGFPPNGGLKEG